MPKNKHKNRYAAYNERIQAFADGCIKRLKERYGSSIPEYTLVQVDKACETLFLIDECKECIKNEGILITADRTGSQKLNPAVTAMTSAQSALGRYLTSMMLTCNAEDKARKADHGEQNMLLDSLINGDDGDFRDYDEEDGE